MNVTWITADTFRLDQLGCYANKVIHASSLEALEKKSLPQLLHRNFHMAAVVDTPFYA